MSQFQPGNLNLEGLGVFGNTQPTLNSSGLNPASFTGVQGNTGLHMDGTLQSNDITNVLLGDDRITVVKGVFMRAPKVRGAVSRPHTLDTSSSNSVNAVNLLGNMLHDQGTLPEAKLRQLGSQIVTCAVDHEGLVAIPNGWDTQRLRFLLIFEVQTRSLRYYEILTGYTDFDSPTVSLTGQEGGVAPEMRLFFNNVIRMKPVTVTDQFGGQREQLTLMSTHQVMTTRDGNAQFDMSGLNRPVPKELITPTTLFQRMELNSGMMGGNHGGILDSRARVGSGGGITMANRGNTLGSNFFANTFKGAQNAITALNIDAHGSHQMNRRSVYNAASNHTLASETTVLEDKVLARIRENTDYSSRGSITWERFSMIFPEASQTCQVIRMAEASESYTYNQNDAFNLGDAQAGNSESWESAHTATVKAQQLLTSIPALMTDCLLSAVTFSATNMTTGFALDPFDMRMSFAASYLGDGVNLNPLVDLFINEFRTRIHPVISENNELHYLFTMHCNALGEMRMTIKYDGLPHTYNYNAGAYADHLFTPVLSGDAGRLNLLAQDFDGILTDVFKY